ncbi:MAG: hypothetical protein NEA02_11860 [Thermoanaerobaculia bacterium]|nr:hypothetical protein [Thermoanaerobaculia bacterium]
MKTRRTLAVLLFVSLLPATLPAAPTAVEFQGVTIGSKLRTTPVDFKTKVGLAGGGFLAPGSYDVEVASTGDKSRVMLLFFQKGRKMGEIPGTLKLGQGVRGGVGPSCKTGIVRPNCNKGEGAVPCNGMPKGGAAKICVSEKKCVAKFCIAMKGGGQATSKGYLTFEQLGFAGGVKPSLRAGAGGGTLLTIPGAGGASVEAQLPAAH